MDRQKQSVVKRTLGSWVFDGNTLLQVLLVVIILVTVVTRVIPLEMQKRIVNEAIYLKQLKLLGIYCTLYFVSVMTASLLKFFINIIQAVISERATAGMRSALFDHILTMPLGFFRGTQPGTVVNSLVNELTLPGNYIGMAVAIPLTNILTLVAFAIYLFRLNPLLAGISFVIYPLMVVVIPLLQGRVNRENRRRINLSRQVSSTIVEAISGLHEVQANGGFALANRNFTRLVNALRTIRVRWSLLKSGVKVVNNFGTSLGPVIIFVLGGYLTIRGELELGALVAFLSAQEKLYDPWKELVEFYQVYQDGSVTYYKTMGFYDVPIEHLMLPPGREPLKLLPAIETENLTLETAEGIKLIEGVTLALKPGEHLALVGFSGSGKSTLAMCLAQLLNYTSGRAAIGGEEIRDLTRADMVCTLGLVSQAPFIFNGTIRENLEYAHAAIHGQEGFLAEKFDPTLDDLIYVLQQSGMFVDVLKFGLTTIIDRNDTTLASTIIQVRKNFQADFGQEMSEWVEFYNDEQYLNHSSVGDNIIFGTARTTAFNADNLVKNTFFMTFLNDADLLRPLLSLAINLAEQTVDILKNIPDEALFFAQSPIMPGEFDRYSDLVQRIKGKNLHQLTNNQQSLLLTLALRFSPGRHKTALMPDFLKSLILEGRHMFRERIRETDNDPISFFGQEDYIYSQTILNNILFGRTKSSSANVQERINQSIVHLLVAEDLLERIIETGMKFKVGTNGNRLSGGQQQKLAIARAFLKSAPILIMDEATSALDNHSQKRIQNVLAGRLRGKTTLIAVVHRLDNLMDYDKIAFMKSGKIIEMGSYDELVEKKGNLYELINRH
ncbi:ATPase family protein [Desulforapulum autotrophicum HRM2]|uniref:ATPase family protein n=1 Tax=Desulforapulum autotrophicum (strain ATCC 43914 / DSM 3382 / VKM B-1955 / HRM2) TaxID=177437 RepID=C0QCF9_DESAH|nr:ATP-binding cassette domain-containing protein [Desulforapulum autotrophicum]ACN17176.1 ATPase family protein [Desulforapulum autotrophicum HRM2]